MYKLTQEQRERALSWYASGTADIATIAQHFVLTAEELARELHTEPRQGPIQKGASAPPVVQCAALTARHFDVCGSVIVATPLASNFCVERTGPGVYLVHGRAEFVGGSRIVRGIGAVRSLLQSR